MLLDRDRPHAVRQYTVEPGQADAVGAAALDAAAVLGAARSGCQAWAVHLAHDRRRVVVVEAWRDSAAFRRAGHAGDLPGLRAEGGLFAWAGTGGTEPTPVVDPAAGVITIDVFRVWRALVGPVSAFNLRNGESFNRQPGCISTTVLRGVTTGQIATYARWRSTADFLAAFTATAGVGPVSSTDDINAAAARSTLGLIRPDYHTYDLLGADDGATR